MHIARWSRIFLRLQQLKQIGLASSAHPTRARRQRPLPKLRPAAPPRHGRAFDAGSARRRAAAAVPSIELAGEPLP